MKSKNMEVFLIIDESGAKGFSDNQEKYPGEFGLLAGFIFPGKMKSEINNKLVQITSNLHTSGKLHITDLSIESQEKLRNSIFALFEREKLIWVYEAIYVQGFYNSIKNDQDHYDHIFKEFNPKIKPPNNKKKERLLSELFQGVLAKALAYCEENFGNEICLTIITDTQDQKITQSFYDKTDEYCDIFEEDVKRVSRYDPELQKVVRGTISIKIKDNDGILSDYSGLTISIMEEESPITLAADVLANSTNFVLKQKVKGVLGIDLNSLTAISDHPLKNLCYGYSDTGSKDFADSHYPYSKNK